MGAPILVPKVASLRILPDPGAPPEATNPTALTRLERIALAQEMTAEAMVRVANRLDQIGDRIEKDAFEMEQLIANGGTLAVEAAAEAGVDCFVAGSAVYSAADPAVAVESLRRQAAAASKHLTA